MKELKNLKEPFLYAKFIKLPLKKQHRLLADLLKEIILKLSTNTSFLLEHYLEIRTWLDLDTIAPTSKNLRDAYHYHLKEAGLYLKEANYLVTTQDKPLSEVKEKLPYAIYLDHLRSSHNVGSILRTVEAFSLGDVYLSLKTPTLDNKQLRKTSRGTADLVTVKQISSLDKLPKPFIALETVTNSLSLFDYPFPETATLIVGNEEYGCSDDTLKQADLILSIPLRGSKNSLNVANAFAIMAAEIIRQKSLNL